MRQKYRHTWTEWDEVYEDLILRRRHQWLKGHAGGEAADNKSTGARSATCDCPLLVLMLDIRSNFPPHHPVPPQTYCSSEQTRKKGK
jgi:hypothetical protein